MCVYSMAGDWYEQARWPLLPVGGLPAPAFPYEPIAQNPFDAETMRAAVKELTTYLELLREIKKLEDASPCPCPNWEARGKPDYIKKFTDKIAELEQALAEQMIINEKQSEHIGDHCTCPDHY